MSVIATVITRYGTIHATDSLITQERSGGGSTLIERNHSKIVRIPRWLGAISYWGTVSYGDWDLHDWLNAQLYQSEQYDSPEDFAREITQNLNRLFLGGLFISQPGIGLHFTAYEEIDNILIPELFLITNYENTKYLSLHPNGLRLSRETYGTASKEPRAPEHRGSEYRLDVHEYLQGRFFLFNNGDPLLYNLTGRYINNAIRILQERGILTEPNFPDGFRNIAKTPIEFIACLQERFVRGGEQMVGGNIYDLTITQDGKYTENLSKIVSSEI